MLASPDTVLGTAPRTALRTCADSTAFASGSVLRTSACGSGRTAAAHAPRRLPSAEFLGVESTVALTADSAVPTARGSIASHTPRIVDAGPAMHVLVMHGSALPAPSGVSLLLDRACNGPDVPKPPPPAAMGLRMLHTAP